MFWFARRVGSDIRTHRCVRTASASDPIKGSNRNVRSVPSAVADGLKLQLEFDRSVGFCRPLRGLGIFRGRDPRVTLASLAHPGLNSVAAPRLSELFTATHAKVTQNVFMQRDCFADIGEGLRSSLSLTDAARKAGHFSDDVAVFTRIKDNLSGHLRHSNTGYRRVITGRTIRDGY